MRCLSNFETFVIKLYFHSIYQRPHLHVFLDTLEPAALMGDLKSKVMGKERKVTTCGAGLKKQKACKHKAKRCRGAEGHVVHRALGLRHRSLKTGCVAAPLAWPPSLSQGYALFTTNEQGFAGRCIINEARLSLPA